MGVFVRTKNVLFLWCFYTCFMLVIIVFLRFLFDFILFGRFGINVEKCNKMREKMVENAGNEKLGRIDKKSAQSKTRTGQIEQKLAQGK